MRRIILGVLVLSTLGCGDDSESIDAGTDGFVRIDASPSDSSIADAGRDARRIDTGPSGCSVRELGTMLEDSCTSDQICVCGTDNGLCEGTGTCSVAFGRRYLIGVVAVAVPTTKPSGECWDEPGCGAPDPYVVVSVDDTPILTTLVADDLFEFSYDPPEVIETTVAAGSTIRLDVFDEDLAADDGILACVVESITAAHLRSRNLSCMGDLGTLVSVIVPAP